jgi:hypothetical protein
MDMGSRRRSSVDRPDRRDILGRQTRRSGLCSLGFRRTRIAQAAIAIRICRFIRVTPRLHAGRRTETTEHRHAKTSLRPHELPVVGDRSGVMPEKGIRIDACQGERMEFELVVLRSKSSAQR